MEEEDGFAIIDDIDRLENMDLDREYDNSALELKDMENPRYDFSKSDANISRTISRDVWEGYKQLRCGRKIAAHVFAKSSYEKTLVQSKGNI